MGKLHIKNMVCGRCIKVVTSIFEQAGIVTESVELGMVKVKTELSDEQEKKIKATNE